MTKVDDIRALGAEGLEVAEIARRMGIRYQHVYNALRGGGRSASISAEVVVSVSIPAKTGKPPLSVETLMTGGFTLESRWLLSPEGDLVLDMPVPKAVGVYSFVKDGFAIYVGVATIGLHKRLDTYGKPGGSQRTNIRLNAILKEELRQAGSIDIHCHAARLGVEWPAGARRCGLRTRPYKPIRHSLEYAQRRLAAWHNQEDQRSEFRILSFMA